MASANSTSFSLSILKEAHEKAKIDQFLGTDEASLIERMGQRVTIVESDYDNIKLTTPEDIYFAEAIIAKRRHDQ
ncbi:2-C-methyl-D-erythritol 4-phosphate cytidylyltransferase [Bacillus sp. N9]